jgi:hypothetical protein
MAVAARLGHARVDHTPVMHAVTGRRVTEVDVG